MTLGMGLGNSDERGGRGEGGKSKEPQRTLKSGDLEKGGARLLAAKARTVQGQAWCGCLWR